MIFDLTAEKNCDQLNILREIFAQRFNFLVEMRKAVVVKPLKQVASDHRGCLNFLNYCNRQYFLPDCDSIFAAVNGAGSSDCDLLVYA